MSLDDSPPDAGSAGAGPSRQRPGSNRVLLVITVLLVLAGLVLLVVGSVGGSMTILYVSIGVTAAAGVVLIVLSRLNRRRAAEPAGAMAALDAPGPGPAGDGPGDGPETQLTGEPSGDAPGPGPAGRPPGDEPGSG
jgi:hypothetical protein